jgi:hypothetical protein
VRGPRRAKTWAPTAVFSADVCSSRDGHVKPVRGVRCATYRAVSCVLGDASDAVTRAAEATAARATFRFELTSECLGPSLPDPTLNEPTGPVAMDASGRVDLSISDMLMEIPGAGPTDIVVNGDDVYMRGEVFEGIPGCSRAQWIHSEADLDDAWPLAGGTSDVRLLIYYLFGVSRL